MKVINYIHIKNMFVHRDTKIEFTDGKNVIIGDIGKGKTLVNESIAFALFGSVALRGKSPQYKKTEIELSFNYNNEVFLIKRKINDASLSMFDKDSNTFIEMCNSTSIVNQKIVSLLGYNYDIYLLSNYCKQKKLAYFSELTPAKRLQYIDKISGIEEGKEYAVYLTKIRKSLKDNLSLLKDMIIEPVIDSSIDLEFDYQSHITVLNNRLNSINDLYSSYNTALNKSVFDLKEPKINITEWQQPLLTLDNNCKDIVKDWFLELTQKENLITSIEESLRKIPELKNEYKNLTLEDVDHMITIHNRNIVRSISDDLHFNCNHCSNELDFKLIMDQVSTNSEHSIRIPIKDLYNIKDYIVNDCKSSKRSLEKQLESLEKEYEEFVEKSFVPELIRYKNYNNFVACYNTAKTLEQEYFKELELYNQIKIETNLHLQESERIKTEIETFLTEQAEIIQLKDSYISHNIERNLYLEKLDIYNKSKQKYDVLYSQYVIVTGLLKDLDAISSKIKNETIPLINHFASKYLNLISNGTMATIEITEDYDLIVDGTEIALKSGGQTDLASLAFRLSLSRSIITGMLPVFIGDEVDSAGSKEVSDDIIQALDTINDDFQVILVTHKNIEDLSNCNIIQL